MFGSFLPGLGWLAPPKSIRAWEPTLLWNQLHSLTPNLSILNECNGLVSTAKISAAKNHTRPSPHEYSFPYEKRPPSYHRPVFVESQRCCPDGDRRDRKAATREISRGHCE